jgi:hypothetical protein
VIRPLAPLLVILPMLSGCLDTSIPTRHNPSCSWDSSVPPNASTICSTVFRTLQSLATAEQKGNNGVVRRLVSLPRVRHRIIRYGASLRGQKVSNLHIVPSFTLDQLRPSYFGAGFYLNGDLPGGHVNSPMTVELRVNKGRAIVINDQPGQEW